MKRLPIILILLLCIQQPVPAFANEPGPLNEPTPEEQTQTIEESEQNMPQEQPPAQNLEEIQNSLDFVSEETTLNEVNTSEQTGGENSGIEPEPSPAISPNEENFVILPVRPLWEPPAEIAGALAQFFNDVQRNGPRRGGFPGTRFGGPVVVIDIGFDPFLGPITETHPVDSYRYSFVGLAGAPPQERRQFRIEALGQNGNVLLDLGIFEVFSDGKIRFADSIAVPAGKRFLLPSRDPVRRIDRFNFSPDIMAPVLELSPVATQRTSLEGGETSIVNV